MLQPVCLHFAQPVPLSRGFKLSMAALSSGPRPFMYVWAIRSLSVGSLSISQSEPELFWIGTLRPRDRAPCTAETHNRASSTRRRVKAVTEELPDHHRVLRGRPLPLEPRGRGRLPRCRGRFCLPFRPRCFPFCLCFRAARVTVGCCHFGSATARSRLNSGRARPIATCRILQP